MWHLSSWSPSSHTFRSLRDSFQLKSGNCFWSIASHHSHTRKSWLSGKISTKFYANTFVSALGLSIKIKLFKLIKFKILAHDLYIVGSSLNGLGNNSSDVDMCIVLPNQSELIDQHLYAIPVLNMVQALLTKNDLVSESDLICAKVPILKFKDKKSQIEVDLNVNNIVGIRNTQLIKCYTRRKWIGARLKVIAVIWTLSRPFLNNHQWIGGYNRWLSWSKRGRTQTTSTTRTTRRSQATLWSWCWFTIFKVAVSRPYFRVCTNSCRATFCRTRTWKCWICLKNFRDFDPQTSKLWLNYFSAFLNITVSNLHIGPMRFRFALDTPFPNSKLAIIEVWKTLNLNGDTFAVRSRLIVRTRLDPWATKWPFFAFWLSSNKVTSGLNTATISLQS
jgi:hypothetical protein